MLFSNFKKILKKRESNKSYNYYDAANYRMGYPKRNSTVSKISWIDNMKNVINRYIKFSKKTNKRNNEIKNYVYKTNYQRVIDDINNFQFNSENITYINELINNFGIIDNPSIELQEKYHNIVEYRNRLISKDNRQFEQNIKEISDRIPRYNANKNSNIDVEESIKKISENRTNKENNDDIDKKIKDISNILSGKEKEKTIDINNYATMDYLNVINYHKNPNIDMKFSKAISIVRDKKLHTEDEWKTAVSVLSSTFGNGKGKNSDTEKKLNDFNKTEKLLSLYGRKIKNNTATPEEKLTYNALLYHLANCDLDSFSIDEIEDYVNDYIIEEADRYIEDVKRYQKK